MQKQAAPLEPIAGLIEDGYLRVGEPDNKTSHPFKINPHLFLVPS